MENKRTLFRFLVLALMMGLNSVLHAQSYCQPTSYTYWNYYISSFKLDTYTHVSKGSSNGYDSSTINSSKTPIDTLLPGKGYTVVIKVGGGNKMYMAYWVDWNNNGSLDDPGEFIDSLATAATSMTSTLNVPKKQLAGTFRIRARAFYSPIGPSVGSCGSNLYNLGETEDYVFAVKSISTNDVGITQIISPGASGCGDSTTKVTVVVGNFGTNAVTNIPVAMKITPKGGTATTLYDTLKTTLNPGQKDTFTFSATYNTFSGSQYSMAAYTQLVKDTFNYNDSAYRIAGVFSGVETPITVGSSLCKPGKVKLYNSNSYLGYNTFWYNSRNSNARIANSDTFYTPKLYTTTTYYAEFTTAYVYNLGEPDNSKATGSLSYTTFTNGLIFDAVSDFTLDSVTVYANSSGKVSVNLLDASNNTLKTVTVSVASSGKHQLYIHMFIPKGTGYTLNAANSTVTGLYRSAANATVTYFSYPYSASGVVDITNSTAGNTRYYFFYDWVVKGPGCYSKRDSFTVNIGGPVASLKQGTPFKGTYAAGTLSSPDTVGLSDTVRYIITPPAGLSNADYGTKWTISNVSFAGVSGTKCPDTAFVYPKATTNGTFTFFPSTAYANDTFQFSYKISVSGCDSTLSRYMYVIGKPTANFTATGVCSGAATTFLNKSTGIGGLTYLWDFGDGTTSNLINPLHIFSNGGLHSIKLVVTAAHGTTDTITKSILLYNHPNANFTFKNTCLGQTTIFSDSSTISSGTISKYSYDFGDGSATDTLASTKHTYTVEDVYSVTLSLVSDKGCTNSVVKNVTIHVAPVPSFGTNVVCQGSPTIFTNNTTDKSGTTPNYTWNFGDGSSSNLSAPTHSYNGGGPFTAWLYATNTFGCEDSIRGSVIVHAKPNTKFGVSNTCVEETTVFTDSSSISAGSITKYEWNFGDSTFTYQNSPSHRFLSAGTFNVSLSQISDQGCVSVLTKAVVIGSQPDASFNSFGTDSGMKFIPVNSSYTSYLWNFGDSSTSTAIAPYHKYKRDSTYKVNLQVSNGSGPCNTNSYTLAVSSTGTGIQNALANAIHLQIYPNPFSDLVQISYSLDHASKVNMSIFEPRGGIIAGNLINTIQDAGYHQLAINANEYHLNAGVYFIKIQVGNSVITERLIVVK